MIKKSDEILSSFMDVESSAFESRLCVKELLRDEGKRSRWERYHLLRDALQGNLPAMVDKGFCNKVMQKVESHGKSDVDMTQGFRGFRYLRPAGSIAIVASMAVIIVWGARWYDGLQPMSRPLEIAEVESPVGKNAKAIENNLSPEGWYVNPKAEARMNSYLVNHAEYAARKDVMPYVRIVGYDTVRPR
jgi:sigma-E factor negative regulatory protein RseA